MFHFSAFKGVTSSGPANIGNITMSAGLQKSMSDMWAKAI